MAASPQVINALSGAIVREIPASHIGAFVRKFETAASDGSCGAGCGSGCCGAACAVAPDDLGVIDAYGHAGFNAADLNDIGAHQLGALKKAISAELTAVAGRV